MVSLRVRRQRERVVEFKNAPNKDGGRVERNFEGRPSKIRGEDNRYQKVNLPPLLAAHLVRKENDHGHDTNDCRELRHLIEEAVKSGQLTHLVKGIKKARRRFQTPNRVDSKVSLIGFMREHSWPLGEVPLKITIGGKPFNTKHKLNKYKHIKPVKQKKSGLGPDRIEVACTEVEELMKAGILQGLRIKGYHQIQMAEEDEDKTTFFIGEGVFCYQKMPFSLKNACATYQRGRNSVKKHIPKDFSVEIPSERDERIAASKIEATRESSKIDNMWKLYTDRALSSDGSGVGPILISPEGKEYTYALWLEFETKNNEAEYEVLRIAQEMEIKSLAIFVDSVDLSFIDRIP
nr:reverse transcriptase domain-containing protein [Tanacetum cinerariifolium]